MHLAIKFVVSALVIVVVSEIAKRSTLLGAVVASLPLTSILAMVWLYRDTCDTAQIAMLCTGILWLTLPSLLLFIVLPLLLRRAVAFYPALAVAAACTVVGYLVTAALVQRFSQHS